MSSSPKSRDAAPEPRWTRKAAWAAIAPLLIAAYPASVGPAVYAMERGWLSAGGPAAAFVNPSFRLAEALPGSPDDLFTRYADWWAELAYSHLDAASD